MEKEISTRKPMWSESMVCVKARVVSIRPKLQLTVFGKRNMDAPLSEDNVNMSTPDLTMEVIVELEDGRKEMRKTRFHRIMMSDPKIIECFQPFEDGVNQTIKNVIEHLKMQEGDIIDLPIKRSYIPATEFFEFTDGYKEEIISHRKNIPVEQYVSEDEYKKHRPEKRSEKPKQGKLSTIRKRLPIDKVLSLFKRERVEENSV